MSALEKFPVEPRRRKILEMLIRIIDIIVYAIIFVGGVVALLYTPNTVVRELEGWEWLIPWWASFLMVGGLLGFIGRVTTVWIIEPAADVAAAVGILIYFLVLGRTALSSVTALVATCMILVCFFTVVRRYLELQLFGSNPASRNFSARVNDILRRRIPNVPSRG